MKVKGVEYSEPGVILASGGIDSTVLLHLLGTSKLLDSVFFVDYGQASAAEQYTHLLHHARRYKVHVERCRFTWPEYARGNGYIFEQGKYPKKDVGADVYAPVRMEEEEFDKYLDETWDFLQGRNIAFLAMAGAYTIARGLGVLYTGFQNDAEEWVAMGARGYGGTDTCPAFVRAFNELPVSGGFSKPLEVLCPFLDTRAVKQEIVNIGRTLFVDLEKTHSCEFFPACGNCHQCGIRKRVLSRKAVLR